MDFKKIVPNLTLLAVVIVAIGLLIAAWNSIQAIFINKGIEIGHNQYQWRIDSKDLEIMNQSAAISLLQMDAITTRAEHKKQLADIMAGHETDKRKLKSQTAEELRKKNAKIEEVLAEKEKDELMISMNEMTILILRGRAERILKDWERSDIKLNAAFKKQFDLQEEKFQICNNYTKKLEKKLKRRNGLLYFLGEAGKIGAAFYFGTKVK
jgi:hypothetical protein